MCCGRVWVQTKVEIPFEYFQVLEEKICTCLLLLSKHGAMSLQLVVVIFLLLLF